MLLALLFCVCFTAGFSGLYGAVWVALAGTCGFALGASAHECKELRLFAAWVATATVGRAHGVAVDVLGGTSLERAQDDNSGLPPSSFAHDQQALMSAEVLIRDEVRAGDARRARWLSWYGRRDG